MRFDDACLIVATDVKMLSWFDLLLCTNHTQYNWYYWHQDKSLKHGGRCIAAATLLPCTDFCDGTHSTHAYLVHTEAHIHTHTDGSTVCGYHKGEISQHGCCCIVTATSSAEPGGPCVMQ